MSAAAQWHDLGPRVVSGLALAVLGAVAVWLGGWVFGALACLVCGLIAWELARMFGIQPAVGLGVLAGAVLALAALLPGIFSLPLILAAALVAAGRAGRQAPLLFGGLAWVMLAVLALVWLRLDMGALWVLWLVLVVIASDVAGYFAGRMLGGPKFWPRVSPKKTWSGTVAGWIAAALVGAFFAAPTGAGMALVAVSVLACLAGQMGDIGESAIKRRAGVKDSSALIPGHGGVFDRFDAMLGAAALVLLLRLGGWLPGPA